jgi:hypothetical protein
MRNILIAFWEHLYFSWHDNYSVFYVNELL